MCTCVYMSSSSHTHGHVELKGDNLRSEEIDHETYPFLKSHSFKPKTGICQIRTTYNDI